MATADRTSRRLNLASVASLTMIKLRRLRFDGAATLVLAGVVVLTSFAVVSLPRFLNDVSDNALQTIVRDAAPINRNISIERGDRIAPAGDGDIFQPVIAEGNDLRGNFTEPVNQIIGDQSYLVDTPNFMVSSFPGEPVAPFPRFLRMRHQQNADQHITLVEGRMPEPAEPVEVQLEEDGQPLTLPVHEIVITAETSERLEVGVGGSMILRAQREDPLNQGLPLSELGYMLVATVSGIIEINEPDEEFWFGDTRLHEPVIVETPDVVEIYGMGLMSPADYPDVLANINPTLMNYGWRYFVDPQLLDAGEIGEIAEDLRALEVRFGASISNADENRLRTGLVRLARTYESQRQLALSMLSLVIAGTLVVALAVSALLGALIASRRQESTILSRSRGASASQIGWAEAFEALIVFVPSALAGMLLAGLLISGRAPWYTLPIAVLVAVTVTGIVLLLARPQLTGDLGVLMSGSGPGRQRSRQRLVVEGVVLLAAVGGLILFRRRGLEAGSLSNPDQGFDPFLTSVPVLLTLAIGIVLLRVYPLPIRLAGWFGSLRRGAVIFVGFRRIMQQPLAARLPLVVMLVATGVAVFSAIVLYSITEGQENSTWQEVGADYRLQSVREEATVSSFLDLSGLDAIEATAEAARLQVRNLTSTLPSGNFTLLAIDTEEYQAVAAGTRADPAFPESMLIDQNVQSIGTETNPIPAIVSTNWAGSQGLSRGDIVMLEARRTEFAIVVRDVRDRFPSLDSNQPFVVVSRPSLDAVDPTLNLRATYIYIKAPASANDEIRETVRGQSFATDVISRPDIYADIADAPLVNGVENGFRATVILATLYAVLAALAGIALTARERARDLGYLRTLGLTSKQASVLTAIEQLPPAVIATGAGAGLGFLMVWLVEPGLDLSSFAGTALPATVRFDPWVVGLVAGAELVTVVATIAFYSYLTRRMQLGNVLRLGDRT
ncbi:FtsX-like permease family protein [soil metagenome]